MNTRLLLLASAFVFAACDQNQDLGQGDGAAGSAGSVAGGNTSAAGKAGSGPSGEGGSGQAGSGQAGSEQAGSGQAGSEQAGSGQAGSGQAGSGQAGSGQAGSEQAGSGQAGSGQAGSGQAGSGQAGSGQAGNGGSGPAGQGGAAGAVGGPGPTQVVLYEGIRSFTLDENHLYVARGDRVVRVTKFADNPIDSDQTAFFYLGTQFSDARINDVVVDATSVFYTQTTLSSDGYVWSSLQPSSPLFQGVGTGDKSFKRTCGIAADSENLYFMTERGLMKGPRVPSGPQPQLGYSKLASPIGCVDSAPGENDATVGVDDTWVYFLETSLPSPRLMKVAKTGGDPVELFVADGGKLSSLVVSDGEVFFTRRSADSSGPGAVFKVDPLSNDVVTLATSTSGAWGVWADGTDVYFTVHAQCDGQGTVQRVARGGGEVTTIASGQNCPSTIQVDGASVFWLGQSTSQSKAQSIFRLPR